MEISLLTERVVSAMYAVVGLSMFLRPTLWLNLIDDILKTNVRTILMMCFGLPLGLWVVLVHNEWTLEPTVIVTIIGWSALVKACLHLAFPLVFESLVPKMRIGRTFIATEGAIFAALCGWAFYYSMGR